MDAKTIKLILLVVAIAAAIAGAVWGIDVAGILDNAGDINDSLDGLAGDLAEEN